MKYGKEITIKSYFDGELRSETVCHETSVSIKDKAHLLSEVLECLEMAVNGTSPKVVIELHSDPKHFVRLVKKHEVE